MISQQLKRPEVANRRLAALREAMAHPRSQEWRDAQSAGIRRAIAEGRLPVKRSDESIEKGAAKLRGRKRPAAVVEKIRLANLGKTRSAEVRLAASERIKREFREGSRKIPSPEARKLIGEKISRAKKGHSPISLEQRFAHSLLLQGRKAKPEHVESRARPMRGRPQKALLTKKGVTNQRSLEGVLRSPENQLHPFRNLTQFVRDSSGRPSDRTPIPSLGGVGYGGSPEPRNPDLFLPEDTQWVKKKSNETCRAAKGLINLFGHGKHVNGSWKGWTIYSKVEDQFNAGRDLLERPELTPDVDKHYQTTPQLSII